MRLMSLANISFLVHEDSSVSVQVVEPGESPVTLEMSVDEVYLFMVQMGNALFEARGKQRKKKEDSDLIYETRKIRKDYRDSEETTEEE
jgi:hypothetical protein